MENLERNRDFKGVWIPKEVWLNENLTLIEKVIFTEIDSLDNEDHCVAGNEYLAEFCQCSESKVSQAIKKLIDLGYIAVVSFDGRHRRLRSCKEKIYQLTETPKPIEEEPKKEVKEKAKKVSRKDQLIEYVDGLDYKTEIKHYLHNWIFNIGIVKGVTVAQLSDKLKKLSEECNNDEDLIYQAIENSYLSGWFGFYKPKSANTPKAKDKATQYYIEQIKNNRPIQLGEEIL